MPRPVVLNPKRSATRFLNIFLLRDPQLVNLCKYSNQKFNKVKSTTRYRVATRRLRNAGLDNTRRVEVKSFLFVAFVSPSIGISCQYITRYREFSFQIRQLDGKTYATKQLPFSALLHRYL